MKKIMMGSLFVLVTGMLVAQSPKAVSDTIPTKMLDSVLIISYLQHDIALPKIVGSYVFAGKKTNVVQLQSASVNMSQNVARMAFAQVPGLNAWDMDGAGTQFNIGSRGTDMHRSIEMNMRQNGYNTNSDMFGYPEDHYTPPLQGIREIQLVRGSAALQFGSQFGGMMNFVMKEGDSSKPFSVESEQTGGSNNFFNSFNAVGGTTGKINYYAYYDSRHGDGWRPNARFDYHAYYANFRYHFNSKGSIAFQFSRMSYVQQIAGGQTDAQFNQDHRQSNRSRNFFNPEINVAAILFNYDLSANTHLEIINHILIGQRNSVQFINTPNISDTFNTALGSYNKRQVDRDYYNGFTTEARLLHQYKIGQVSSTLTTGARFFTQLTKRRQKGVGTTGADFDLSLTQPYGIDLRLNSTNYAVFAENLFQLTPRLSITPGFRYEVINSKMNGVIINASYPVTYSGSRNFPLFGTGMQYQVNKFSELYGNWSQAYRPYLYASITPADRVDVIDPNLKDTRGYDIDFGYRGHYKNFLTFDVNAFYMFYGDRIGLLSKQQGGTPYLYTTNIGNSLAKGIEAYFEISLIKALHKSHSYTGLHIFHALSYTNARYTSGELNNAGVNKQLSGNHVEGVPDWINRTGLMLTYKTVSATVQFSQVGKCFSDANNSLSSATGAVGIVPAYQVWDITAEWKLFGNYRLSAGINNLADAKYFTRRITMYPGPGILPADGRTFYISAGIKL